MQSQFWELDDRSLERPSMGENMASRVHDARSSVWNDDANDVKILTVGGPSQATARRWFTSDGR